MRYKCNNPNYKTYHKFGGLGIGYSQEWNSFPAFESWAISVGYKDRMSLLRYDNTKDFTPDNCFWSNKSQRLGLCRSSLYTVWNLMKQRCINPKHKSYKDYGGRGITYCKEWDTFPPFKEWAFKNGYSKGLTLDRIDNNENYSPANCRWVTQKENCNNRRSSVRFEYHGETHTLPEWAAILGIKRHTLWSRIHKLKMPIEKAFSTPVNR